MYHHLPTAVLTKVVRYPKFGRDELNVPGPAGSEGTTAAPARDAQFVAVIGALAVLVLRMMFSDQGFVGNC